MEQESTAAPITLILNWSATITGGTGRFANATGSLVVRRTFQPATGKTEGSFDGAITVARGGRP